MEIRILAAISTAALVSGCAGLGARIDAALGQTESKVSDLVKNVGRTAPDMAPQAPQVETERGMWLGKNVVKLEQQTLPPIFYESASFDREVSSLSDLAERI